MERASHAVDRGEQWTVGIGAGVLYGVLRDHIPASGLRRGLLYGPGFSVVVDEGLTPALDTSALAPGVYPSGWRTARRRSPGG